MGVFVSSSSIRIYQIFFWNKTHSPIVDIHGVFLIYSNQPTRFFFRFFSRFFQVYSYCGRGLLKKNSIFSQKDECLLKTNLALNNAIVRLRVVSYDANCTLEGQPWNFLNDKFVFRRHETRLHIVAIFWCQIRLQQGLKPPRTNCEVFNLFRKMFGLF